jgi:acid stress-induced BolA-like protein IbaG/YrbA
MHLSASTVGKRDPSVVCDGDPKALGDNRASMSDPTADDVRRFIAAGLACEHLEVEGDGRHFFATIVSVAFEGKARVRRHQQVYAALGDRMREQIHALSMKTLTPAEWAADSQRSLHHHH